MGRYDGSHEGNRRFPGYAPEFEGDNWPDAPAPDGQAELDDDLLDEPYAGTALAPDPASWNSYDGGPATESFVIDLREPVEAPAPSPSQWPERSAEWPDSSAEWPERSANSHHSPTAAPDPAPAAYDRSATAAAPAPYHHPAPAAPTPPATEPPSAGRRTEQPSPDVPPIPALPSLAGAESLTADTVLKRRRERPRTGWRKGVFTVSGGRVNLGPSPADRARDELVGRARTPVTGCHRLAVISLKGGVGKTTTTAALGAMFADLRGDRVIAVDANPDRGTLGERVPRESGATVRHLLDARDQLHRYADVRAFTSQSPTRLEVLASDSDPGASMAFSEQDYRDTVSTLERFYNLVLTDCGTGLLHSAMAGILGLADSLVVVSSASLDGARSASATLDWLEAHGFDRLAREAVVAISSVRPGGGIVDVMQLEDHFASRSRDVVTIPYDPHLEAGGVLMLDELAPSTVDAYHQLAATVGEGFAAGRESRLR